MSDQLQTLQTSPTPRRGRGRPRSTLPGKRNSGVFLYPSEKAVVEGLAEELDTTESELWREAMTMLAAKYGRAFRYQPEESVS